MTKITHHPDEAQLYAFSQGTLGAAPALVIAAHCDMCSGCQQTVWDMEAQQAEALMTRAISEDMPADYMDMLATIVQTPVSPRDSIQVTRSETLELNGRRFKLPRALQRLAGESQHWNKNLGSLWHRPVQLGGPERGFFIYMGAGGKVPEHTHRGQEYTLVLDGEFEDGVSRYSDGDFSLTDGKTVHRPHADTADGCLVFSVLDEPLHFTQGAARLLNPFSRLFF